ncbi:conserved hypothetical protein [Desulfamplus magnetovallimortis]|uniref:Uncharacterized protein n=1 Tax=Desulfamplus magnetovallimortis TaxID=1246637 RepID=A0A1W1H4V9_9BACT|nr:methyltransferase domain-containing protein [Desulfamplus magnetovallimortis]SLM27509.1 conserved hypothetical protein [Desulfamplus magnetovallimortis]
MRWIKRKKDVFEKKMVDILNHGALNLAMSFGYRMGLFAVMEEAGKPLTPLEIAEKAGVSERYVREWLGIMCTGSIVDITHEENSHPLYHLPPEHSFFLTGREGNSNMCVYTQEIPLLTEIVMERIAEDFKRGEGVPFSAYPRFQEFMAELSHAKHRSTLIQKFIPTVDDGKLADRLKSGIKVCDLGCGQGVALHLMASAFPESFFTGIDNHSEAIEAARSQGRQQGLDNIEFILIDAATIKDKDELSQKFDYVVAFDSIHDQTRPLQALQGVKHMLVPGGLFSMVDIDASSDHAGNIAHSMAPFLYTVSLMHCMPVGLWENGAGLGMMWGREKAIELLSLAGFDKIETPDMDFDPFNVHYLCRV